MSTINSKLGLKPNTRTRQATHGRAIARGVMCPNCQSTAVRHTLSSKATDSHWCAQCGAFFTPAASGEVNRPPSFT